MSSYQNSCPSH